MTLEYKKPTVENIPDDELFFGHKACAGCGGSLAVRAALKVLGPHAVCALPAGCMSAVGFNFPQLSFANNAMITPFAATAAVAAGIEAGLRAQGKKPDDCTVVGIAGDGGTADIGIQALSGAIDRNDDILYICYDNEAYMNTGIQKSSQHHHHARGWKRAWLHDPEEESVRGCRGARHSLCGDGVDRVSARFHEQGGSRGLHQGDEIHPRHSPVSDGLGLRG